MFEITSSTNAMFRSWKSLLTSKGIRTENQFLLSGEKLIREFAKESKLEILFEILGPGHEPLTKAPKVCRLSADLFRELDDLGTHFNLLVVRTPEIPSWNPSTESRPQNSSGWSTGQRRPGSPAESKTGTHSLEIFCPLGDPQNVGALLRSAEAFGASKVVLLAEAANPFLPKAIKASAGSSLRVRLEKGPKLSELTGHFVGLDLQGTPLPDFTWPRNTRLLVGEEGPGLKSLSSSAQLQPIFIPTAGVESLNAGVATGIALFHFCSQTWS